MTFTELLEAEMILRMGYHHKTRDGKYVRIKDMSDQHLINTYLYFSSRPLPKDKLQVEKDEFDAAIEYFITHPKPQIGIISFKEDPNWELNTKDRICQDED